jgi:hypothetical protein
MAMPAHTAFNKYNVVILGGERNDGIDELMRSGYLLLSLSVNLLRYRPKSASYTWRARIETVGV